MVDGNYSGAGIPRGFSEENPEFGKAKSIGAADLEWILARNCEGTEQLR